MRKKRLIIISSILSVFAVMIILASTVFMLKNVQVDIVSANNSVIFNSDAEGIIASAKFNYGGNLLFMKFSNQIERIEEAYPYAKVEKVERKFPNKVVVHISERVPAAFAKTDEYVYVLDKDLKVLNVVYATNYLYGTCDIPESAKHVPEINLEIKTETSDGQRIENASFKEILQNIVLGLSKSNKEISQLSSITISYENEELRLLIGVENNEMKLLLKGVSDLSTKMMVGIQKYFAHIKLHPDATGVFAQNTEKDYTFTQHDE